jgi:Recombinase/Recombinase zinc beta ribbon domain
MERLPEVEVVFHVGHFERSPAGEFTWTTMAAAHTMERKMTGAKIREAKRYAASKGEMVGAVPAGYRWEGSGRSRRLVIDDQVAPLVRRVFAEYATGKYSTRDIARRLNTEGAVVPRFTGGWRADTVAQLLANVAYIAKTYPNRTHREGPLLDAQWPALIDQDTWDQVQRFRQARYGGGGGRKPISELRSYVFQGLLRCVRCDRRMHCHWMGGRAYYNCRGNDLAKPCGRLVREDALLPWAEQLLMVVDAFRPDDLRDVVAGQLAEDMAVRAPDAGEQVQVRLERIADLYAMGHWTRDRYLAERERLERLLEEVSAESRSDDAPFVPLGSLMEGWRTGDSKTRHDLVAAFFDELDVLDGKITTVVPRRDRAAEVMALLEKAYAQYCPGSPGGIRTRDLSLERAAS